MVSTLEKPDLSGLLENDSVNTPAPSASLDAGGGEAPIADPGAIPESLFDVPGFVRQVMDFTLSKAPYPNKGLAFCGALALQSYLCGRKVRTPGDLRPNIYLLALASSGTGKDFPRKVNSQVLYLLGSISALGDKFASGQGIQDALYRNPAMLFQNDEMDGVLRQINLAKDNALESIPNVLMTLYTSASDVYPLRVKANQDQALHIDQPHLTLFGTATPQYFYEALSHRMLTNGLFARMMIIDIGKRGKGRIAGSPRDIPKKIIETAKYWAENKFYEGRADLLDIHPDPRIVPFSYDAREALTLLMRRAETHYNQAEAKNDEIGKSVWSRTCENAEKLALLYACSESHEEPIISLPAVLWAEEFAMRQTQRQLHLAETFVAENPFHAECLKFLRRLEGGEWIPRSDLLRMMRCKSKEFDQIVTTLLQQGQIDEEHIQKSTKPGFYYRLAEN